MGVRIHKALGYGLTDVAQDDARINWESPIHPWARIQVDECAYLRSLTSRKTDPALAGTRIMLTSRSETELDTTLISECVALDMESELNALVIRPVWMNDWFRSDDPIDYIEAEDMSSQARFVRGGIYPYSAVFMDKRTHERLSPQILTWVRLMTREPGRWELDPALHDIAQMFAEDGGFSSHEEAEENVVPIVPEEIIDLAHWGKLFTDPATVYDLRPMIYTYWS